MLSLYFQITVASYVRIVQHLNVAEMHTGFSNPLSSRSIVKPCIVCYIGCAPLYRQHRGARKKRGNERRNVICS